MAGLPNVIKVAIVGDAKGLTSATAKGESALSKFSKRAAGIGKVAGAAFGGVAVAAGVGLFKVGETFDGAYDHIRTTTGKTGKALGGLEKDFRAVFTGVPTDADKAGEAVATLAQKLELSGPGLRKLAKQELELSRITDTGLNTNLATTTDLFNNFDIPAGNYSSALDVIFRASQASGLGVDELSKTAASSGLTLRAAGLDYEHSIALIATLGKAGVDASAVIPGIGKALATAAKDGKPAEQVLSETFATIKNAPDFTTASSAALEVFGSKAGPKLAKLIREGKLSVGELLSEITGGKDTILKAGRDTEDFSEKWTRFKNKVLVKLAPLAARVFDALGTAMDKLPAIISNLQAKGERLTAWAQRNKPIVAALGAVVGTVLVGAFIAWAASMVTAAIAFVTLNAPIIATIAAVAALAAGVAFLWTRFPALRRIVLGVVDAIASGIKSFVNVALSLWRRFGGTIVSFTKTQFAALRQTFSGVFNVISGIVKVFVALFKGDWSGMWKALQQVARGAFDLLRGIFKAGLNVLTLPFRLFRNAVKGNLDDLFRFFKDLPRRLGTVIGVVEDIITAPFRLAFNAIASLWNNTVGKLSFKVPGWVPGIGGKGFDVPDIPVLHSGGVFKSGRGQGLALLEDGEVVRTRAQEAALAGAGGGGNVIINGAILTPQLVGMYQRRTERRNGRWRVR